MTDNELIQAVASKVMGWTIDEHMLLNANGDVVYSQFHNPWEPLSDFNHCWQVVEAMRKRGWLLKIKPVLLDKSHVGFCKLWDEDFLVGDVAPGDERRAILQAALQVVDSEEWEEQS